MLNPQCLLKILATNVPHTTCRSVHKKLYIALLYDLTMAGDNSILKPKFLKAFANLPEKVKSEEVIAVVDDKPYTWLAAAVEIKSESETGRKILKVLKELGVL